MVVGVCKVAFLLPGNASLKGKRSIVRRIVDRTRAKFNVAVAEVEDMDAHRRAVIGLAVVSNDARHVNSMLDRISSFMSSLTEAVPSERSLEILHVGGEAAPFVPGYGSDTAPDTATDTEWEDDER